MDLTFIKFCEMFNLDYKNSNTMYFSVSWLKYKYNFNK